MEGTDANEGEDSRTLPSDPKNLRLLTLEPVLRWNRGNGRIIRSDPLYFHESVRKRKAVADPQYKPSGKPELKERIGNREPQYVQ